MNPNDYYFGFSSGTGGYYSQKGPYVRPPSTGPYEWPKQKEEYPLIQEGDKGMIIITQASMGWRQLAINDIVRQVEERERQIKCQLFVNGENLPDGSLLVTWGRYACGGIPGGPK